MDTEKKWARRVAAWQSSGLTSAEYCAGRRQFTAGGLRYWAHRLRRGEGTAAARVDVQPALRLVRLERVPARVAAAAQAETLSSSPLIIELGGARVTVPAGVDGATLRTVLDALAIGSGARR